MADLEAKSKQRHTAQRIYSRLKKQFPEFYVSDRSVRAYVSKRKKEIGLTGEGYLPLDHPPGEAQIDFGEAQFIEKEYFAKAIILICLSLIATLATCSCSKRQRKNT